MKNKNYLSVKDYSTKCGISVTQVYNRSLKGLIEIEQLFGRNVIDIEKYPIQKKLKRGKKTTSQLLSI